MNRFFAISIVLWILFSFSCVSAESVTNMPYLVKLPDVIRDGLYTGEVKGGIPHGYGVFVTENSSGVSWHYLGEWESGKMCGQGGQYWDIGKATVGSFKDNDMISGNIHDHASFNVTVDYDDIVDGCYKGIEYREDGTILFDGYIEFVTNKYRKGTFYTKEGDVFFSGEIGEGFNMNLMYIK